MKVNELKHLLKIDPLNLDEAVLQQPTLYYQVGQKHALAVSERDKLYDQLKITDAKLNEEIRRELNEDGIKATEAMIQAKVLAEPEHAAVVTAYGDAKYVADELQILKEAFSQRSYMLRELVELYTSGYYGSDTIKPKRLGEKPQRTRGE